jgi:hypothetical protein
MLQRTPGHSNGLATPYDTIRDSASHLKGSELVEVLNVVVSGFLPLDIFG